MDVGPDISTLGSVSSENVVSIYNISGRFTERRHLYKCYKLHRGVR